MDTEGAILLRHVKPHQTAWGFVVHIDNAPTIDAAYPQRVISVFPEIPFPLDRTAALKITMILRAAIFILLPPVFFVGTPAFDLDQSAFAHLTGKKIGTGLFDVQKLLGFLVGHLALRGFREAFAGLFVRHRNPCRKVPGLPGMVSASISALRRYFTQCAMRMPYPSGNPYGNIHLLRSAPAPGCIQ